MTFNEYYINDVKSKLETLCPNGVSCEVYDSLVPNGINTDEYTFVVIVKFGASSKAQDGSESYIQPITFTIITNEVDSQLTYQVMDVFYKSYTRTLLSLDDYNGRTEYNSPVYIRNYDVLSGQTRSTLMLTGQVIYSKDLLFGRTIKLDDEEVKVISVSGAFNTNTKTPPLMNGTKAKGYNTSSNSSITLKFYAKKSTLSRKLLSNIYRGSSDEHISVEIDYGFGFLIPIDYVIMSVSDEYSDKDGFTIFNLVIIQSDVIL